MDDFNTKLDRIQREFEALQRQVKAQNALHLQSLAEQREVITSAFGDMQRAFVDLERAFRRAIEETQANMTRGFGQVHAALWRHELLLKDLTVQTESRFGIVSDVLDLTRSQHALMEERWSDLDERVRRLEERDPPAA